jgi:hypothetical protein
VFLDYYPVLPSQVAPQFLAFSETGIFAADINPPHEGGLSVDDGHFSVIALVEPGDATAEGGWVEGQAFDAALFQMPEKELE